MKALVRCRVEVAAPARHVWGYVTDWERQGEWIPLTRVERLDAATGPGGRIRAWTGVGPLGFWDTMTLTAWAEDWAGHGSARCEVLHTGRVVRGDGGFAVTGHAPGRCTLVWWERLEVPGGRLGALLWRLTGPLFTAGVRQALRRMARLAEEQQGG